MLNISSAFPPLHSTHLSSSTIPHLFLSSNPRTWPQLEPQLHCHLSLPWTYVSHWPILFLVPFQATFPVHLFFPVLIVYLNSSSRLLLTPDSSSSASFKPYFLSNVSYLPSNLHHLTLSIFVLSASPTSLHLAPRISAHTTFSLFFLLTFSIPSPHGLPPLPLFY